MTVVDTEFSEEITLSAWLGVTRDEAIEMERQLEQMFADMKGFQERTAAANADINKLAAETDIALKQLMTDLKLI